MKFRDYTRRYLTQFDTIEIPQRITGTLVLGSGVAGLRAAIEAAKDSKVLVVSKDTLDLTTTSFAQGGIAIPVDPSDNSDRHVSDTLKTGKGICDEAVVQTIIKESSSVLDQLMKWGLFFDTIDGEYDLGKEGGHSSARILRAHGDCTGKELQNVLLDRALENPNIHTLENTSAVDLLTENGTCHGVLVYDKAVGLQIIWAGAVVLATGGSGQVFRETTNPELATGDGLAMSIRAGAKVADLEFFQFHPTTLYIAGAVRALISEALRGEGALLRNSDGTAFMNEYHKDAELAPRDVVSRAIVSELTEKGQTGVFLDFTHLSGKSIKDHFPALAQICDSFNLDLNRDMIPVRPSAHYQIGGVWTDLTGQTSIERLYACGEVACTGLHGANRLASNSLLEGFIMGRRSGAAAGITAAEATATGKVVPKFLEITFEKYKHHHIIIEDVAASLRSLMWRSMGVERDEKTMQEAIEQINFWSRYVLDREFRSPVGWRLQNMLLVSALMLECALERTESRGVHYRLDYPETDDARWKKHSLVTLSGKVQ